MNNETNNKMEISRIKKGLYKINAFNTVFILRENKGLKKWQVFNCENASETTCDNWVDCQMKTKKETLKFLNWIYTRR